jgi:pimeloyl-ACP methyl ester carboxylesterase
MRLAVILTLVALALAAGWGTTLRRAAQREAAAEAAYPPQGQFVTVDGVRMHAVVTGAGPDLVLVHGASGSVRDFNAGFTQRLSARYRVIAVDRPGFGWSDPSPRSHSIHEDARLIRGAVAALGADRPIVLGHSYGGAVALAWAVDAPETVGALVMLSAPSHPWETPLDTLYRITSAPYLRRIAVPLIAAWVPDSVVAANVRSVFPPQAMPEGYVAAFGAAMSLRRPALYLNAEERADLLSEIAALVPAYPALTTPIEAVHGDADTIVGLHIHAERLAQDAPTDHLVTLPGIGHMPHHVAPSAVIEAIDRAAARAGM